MRKTIICVIAAVLMLPLLYGCSNSSKPVPTEFSYDESTTISYLGPEGTYTEEAAEFFFDSTGSFVPRRLLMRQLRMLHREYRATL